MPQIQDMTDEEWKDYNEKWSKKEGGWFINGTGCLGAAGCMDHSTKFAGVFCPQFSRNAKTGVYTCCKHHVTLEKHHITFEPIRPKICKV